MQSIGSISPENTSQKLQSKTAGNVKGKSEGGCLSQAKLGVSRIYKLIRGNRVSRNKFMSSIVRKFDNPSWSNSVVPFLMWVVCYVNHKFLFIFSLVWHFRSSLFFNIFFYRYCTEILALLPFTLPDEPLYLIYSINRVIQVRAGALEANMKGLILYLSQRNARMVHENGVVQREPAEPVYHHMATVDLNGTIQQKPAAQFDYGPLRPFDLNGSIQEQAADHSNLNSIASRCPKTQDMNSGESFDVSKDDVEKIQVLRPRIEHLFIFLEDRRIFFSWKLRIEDLSVLFFCYFSMAFLTPFSVAIM